MTPELYSDVGGGGLNGGNRNSDTGGGGGKGVAMKVPRGRRANKKGRKVNKESFYIYIFKVLKQVHDDQTIAKSAMGVLNSLINDLLERLAFEANRLLILNKRKTLTDKEIQTSARLILPQELYSHAIKDARKALDRYKRTTQCDETFDYG